MRRIIVVLLAVLFSIAFTESAFADGGDCRGGYEIVAKQCDEATLAALRTALKNTGDAGVSHPDVLVGVTCTSQIVGAQQPGMPPRTRSVPGDVDVRFWTAPNAGALSVPWSNLDAIEQKIRDHTGTIEIREKGLAADGVTWQPASVEKHISVDSGRKSIRCVPLTSIASITGMASQQRYAVQKVDGHDVIVLEKVTVPEAGSEPGAEPERDHSDSGQQLHYLLVGVILFLVMFVAAFVLPVNTKAKALALAIGLALGTTIVCFGVFSSTATVAKDGAQLGGAIAGLVSILVVGLRFMKTGSPDEEGGAKPSAKRVIVHVVYPDGRPATSGNVFVPGQAPEPLNAYGQAKFDLLDPTTKSARAVIDGYEPVEAPIGDATAITIKLDKRETKPARPAGPFDLTIQVKARDEISVTGGKLTLHLATHAAKEDVEANGTARFNQLPNAIWGETINYTFESPTREPQHGTFALSRQMVTISVGKTKT